jgi:hypothetical protein
MYIRLYCFYIQQNIHNVFRIMKITGVNRCVLTNYNMFVAILSMSVECTLNSPIYAPCRMSGIFCLLCIILAMYMLIYTSITKTFRCIAVFNKNNGRICQMNTDICFQLQKKWHNSRMEKVLMSEIEIEFGLTLSKFHHSIKFYINVIDMQISIEFLSTQTILAVDIYRKFLGLLD